MRSYFSSHVETRPGALERIILKKRESGNRPTWYSSRARAIIQRYFTSRSHSPREEKWWSGGPAAPRRNSFWQISYIELMFICRARRKISRPRKWASLRRWRRDTRHGQNFGRSIRPLYIMPPVRSIKSLYKGQKRKPDGLLPRRTVRRRRSSASLEAHFHTIWINIDFSKSKIDDP